MTSWGYARDLAAGTYTSMGACVTYSISKWGEAHSLAMGKYTWWCVMTLKYQFHSAGHEMILERGMLSTRQVPFRRAVTDEYCKSSDLLRTRCYTTHWVLKNKCLVTWGQVRPDWTWTVLSSATGLASISSKTTELIIIIINFVVFNEIIF